MRRLEASEMRRRSAFRPGAAVERREAPRSMRNGLANRLHGRARLGAGLANLLRRRAGGPIARLAPWGPRKPPGASRRSIPSFEREEKGTRACQAPQRIRAATRWLNLLSNRPRRA
jgi:hypothetical protein